MVQRKPGATATSRRPVFYGSMSLGTAAAREGGKRGGVLSMLHELHIQNYAVIEALALEFGPGLTLLSGETGSGKSILVDALGLALGGRASPDVVRTGADRATVTAIFRAEGKPPWKSYLEELELGGDAESEIILRREVHAGGRSRLLVNDQPVTLAAAKALARVLVEVHGQGEHVLLFSRGAQLDLLDQFAGLEESVEHVGELFRCRRKLEREMEALSGDEQDRLRAIDLLSFQAQEIEQARLEPGEDARLEDEKRVLMNLEKVRAAAASAFNELYEDEGSACSRLASVSRSLEALYRYDATVGPYREPLAGAMAAADDLALFLRNYLDALEANPGRLEEVEDRLALTDRLKRKYGHTLQEVVEYGERARAKLATLERADERREQLRADLESATTAYQRAAGELSESRRSAAAGMEKLVREELAQLGMEKTRFEVHFGAPPMVGAASVSERNLDDTQGGAKGLDEIELRIAPNPGEEPRPLEKIASGGELSRLMLALRTVAGKARMASARAGRRDGRTPPAFVFDEVDTGIGGRVAECVGQRLKRLSRETQVLCVTHLPQIACFADHHYYVEKRERDGRTVATVTLLDTQKERAAELARMLSGSQITDAVLKHAATMLKQAAGL